MPRCESESLRASFTVGALQHDVPDRVSTEMPSRDTDQMKSSAYPEGNQMNRIAMLRSLVNVDGFGLEIGPSHAPVFPKREGFNVETVDYTDAISLREKYAPLGIDISAIEDVDYISDGRALHDVVTREHAYDYVFSSHAIEHVTDFVGYIRSCERLLKPGGIIAFAVPDKRYTFDALQAISTTGQVLEAHARNQSRHSPATVFDFIANSTQLGGRDVWTKLDTGAITLVNDLSAAKAVFDDAMTIDARYHDVHGWIFTPNSFRLIIRDLRELGLIQVEETHMSEAGALEFYVALQLGGVGHGLSRIELQRRVIREQVLNGLQLLAEGEPDLADMFEHLLHDRKGPINPPAPEPAADITPVTDSPVIESPVIESPGIESPAGDSSVVGIPTPDSPPIDDPVVDSPIPAAAPQVEAPKAPTRRIRASSDNFVARAVRVLSEEFRR